MGRVRGLAPHVGVHSGQNVINGHLEWGGRGGLTLRIYQSVCPKRSEYTSLYVTEEARMFQSVCPSWDNIWHEVCSGRNRKQFYDSETPYCDFNLILLSSPTLPIFAILSSEAFPSFTSHNNKIRGRSTYIHTRPSIATITTLNNLQCTHNC